MCNMSPEKRSKKDKKRKKEKKHKKQRSDDAVDKDKNPAVLVPFDSNIAAAVSRTSDTSVSTFSWESAFAAAATIQPEDLDEAFLNRTSTPLQDDGLAKIALLSQEQKKSKAKESETDLPREKMRTSTDQVHVTKKKEKKKKKKRTRSASNDVAVALNSHEEQDAVSGLHAPENNPLEGKMVSHPTHHGEQIMVLVDTKQATIFSAFDRTPNGNLIPIGKMVAGEAILDKDALSEKNGTSIAIPGCFRLVDDLTVREHVSKPARLPYGSPFWEASHGVRWSNNTARTSRSIAGGEGW